MYNIFLKNRYVYTLSIVLGLCVASFVVGFNVNAADLISINNNEDDYDPYYVRTQENYWVGQTFTATNTNISAIALEFGRGYFDLSDCTDAEIYLCLGTATDYDCTGASYLTSWTFPKESYGYNTTWHYASTTEPIPSLPGATYTITLHAATTTATAFSPIKTVSDDSGLSGNYTGGTILNTFFPSPNGLDISFKVYYSDEDVGDVIIEELPDWTGNISVGSETHLQYNRHNFCYIGNDCYVIVNYGYDVIGSTLSLTDFYSNIIDSTILNDQPILNKQITITDPGTPTTQNYCLWLDSASSTREIYCDLEVTWIDKGFCSATEVCSDVATTSEFLYGIQCGARQTVCWLFNPTAASLAFFQKSIQNFEDSFPFNLAFGLVNEMKDTIDEATTTGITLGIPFIDEDGEYYMRGNVSSTTYQDAFGTSTASNVYNILSYLIWGITAILILVIIIVFAIL